MTHVLEFLIGAAVGAAIGLVFVGFGGVDWLLYRKRKP